MERREMLRRTTGLAALLALPAELRGGNAGSAELLAAFEDSALRRLALARTDRPHLAVAERAAAWIRTARIETEHGVTWAWNPTEAPDEPQTSLYTGSPGVVLFLLELHHASGDRAHLDEARKGADHLIATLPEEPEATDAGLYTGLAGWAFTFDEVFRATGDARYRRATLRAEGLIRDGAGSAGRGVAWSPVTDIVSGTSGTLLWLLKAHEREGDDTLLGLAVRAGDRLVELGEPAGEGLAWSMSPAVENRYPNFSHGTAGVAYALATLHQRSGEERFLDAAVAGSRYLASVADHEGGGCRVFHHQPGGEDLFYLSWCHGPPGTARLARRLERVTGDERWRHEVTCWARGVLATGAPERRSPGYWNNVSQCCGDAGVGSFFLALDELDPRPEYRSMVERVTTRLLAEAVEDPVSGGIAWVQAEHRVRPEWTVPQTGFMQGAAGIGTWFLHLDGASEGRSSAVRWPDSPWWEPA